MVRFALHQTLCFDPRPRALLTPWTTFELVVVRRALVVIPLQVALGVRSSRSWSLFAWLFVAVRRHFVVVVVVVVCVGLVGFGVCVQTHTMLFVSGMVVL